LFDEVCFVLIQPTTITTILRPSGFCSGLLGWASTRQAKPVWIYWSKR